MGYSERVELASELLRPDEGNFSGVGRSIPKREKGAVDKMKRIKIVGLCLVAVFAMTAVAASGAQAAPEYFHVREGFAEEHR